MSVLRSHALSTFASRMEDEVPELRGRINPGPCEATKMRQWPHLSIWPVSWGFHPDADGQVHCDLGRTRAVFNVGRFEGTVQLRLGARTHKRRMDLEDKVTQAFLKTPQHPGIIIIDVPDCHDAVVCWELGDADWRNEAAFSKQWFSILAVTVQIPALVTRDGVYTMDDLRVTLTEDVDSEVASIPADEQWTVRVLEDGSIENVP